MGADAMMKRCIAMLAAVACSAELTSAFLAPAPLALRSNVAAMPLRRAAGVTSLRAKTYDETPDGERHHPYYDAPEDRMKNLSVNQPPPEPNVDFSRGAGITHPDFDAPPERQIAAGHVEGAGAAAAKSAVEPAFFDAPLDKVKAAGNIHVNEPPPEPNSDFSRGAGITHPDFDAPVERMIAADNIVKSTE